VAQIEASLTQITAVRVEATETGLQVILETAAGELATPTTQTIGNALIADIPNATIAEEFSQANPIEGIALVNVTSLPDDRVRVAITGTDAPPVAEVTAEAQGLAFAVRLGEAGTAAEDDAIQVVVTGEQNEGYNPSSASTATRTDTPLRDIPQSIQVVSQQIIQEQQANNIVEVLQNVSGVIQTSPNYSQFPTFTIRGFEASDFAGNFLRDGLRDTSGRYGSFANVERIEVLRGPASVLFGGGNPGGTINIITKQPLREPFYSVEATIGSYNLYRGAADLSGPLNDSRTILYRLNASYENAGTFIDFINRENLSIASTLNFAIGDNTTLTLGAEYDTVEQALPNGLPAIGTVLPNRNGEIPRNRNIGEPNSEYSPEIARVGLNLEHQFDENWSLQSAFRFSHFYNRNRNSYFIRGLEPDQRTIQRGVIPFADDRYRNYALSTNILGGFSTGSIQHQFLVGFDLNRFDQYLVAFQVREGAPLDLFDPVYNSDRFSLLFEGNSATITDSLGIYLQDQISLTDNLLLLLGGRLDFFGQTTTDRLNGSEQEQSGNAFSPRLGVVYRLIPAISLYASYSRSFTPTIGRSITGDQFRPERGTQYEIGVKADVNSRLSATLALYDLTRSNVLTADPINPGFSIQSGVQSSRGVELNLSGEVLPGWNIFAGYAYTDARVTEDNTVPVGNRLNNAPEHSFSLWTSYELQEGDLQGLGFGLGLFYVSDRQGDLANSFTLPSYIRTDAAIFYRHGQFRASLNIRNLFDLDYFDSAFSDTTVAPGEPFTIQGTLSWRF
jgi:iron complex outermembrane receptor protein